MGENILSLAIAIIGSLSIAIIIAMGVWSHIRSKKNNKKENSHG